jgi:hypothetical protein
MNTDLGVLFSRVVSRIASFRPLPEFAETGLLPWFIFFGVILLNVLWALAFCALTLLTEGAPGVAPVIPIRR